MANKRNPTEAFDIGIEDASELIAAAADEQTWRHLDVIIYATPDQSIDFLSRTFETLGDECNARTVNIVASCMGTNEKAESALAWYYFGAPSIINGVLEDGYLAGTDADTIASVFCRLKESNIDVYIAEGLGYGVEVETHGRYGIMAERITQARQSEKKIYHVL